MRPEKQKGLSILFEKSGKYRIPSELKGQMGHAISGTRFLYGQLLFRILLGLGRTYTGELNFLGIGKLSLPSAALNPQYKRDSGSWDSAGFVIGSGPVE